MPLIGRADWNDCLNLNCFSTEPSESFQTTANIEGRVAESVFIAGLFVFVGPDYAEICRMRGLDDVAVDAEAKIDNMRNITLTHGFDGTGSCALMITMATRSVPKKTKKVKSSSSHKVSA